MRVITLLEHPLAVDRNCELPEAGDEGKGRDEREQHQCAAAGHREHDDPEQDRDEPAQDEQQRCQPPLNGSQKAPPIVMIPSTIAYAPITYRSARAEMPGQTNTITPTAMSSRLVKTIHPRSCCRAADHGRKPDDATGKEPGAEQDRQRERG